MQKLKSRYALTGLSAVVTLAICLAITANRTGVAQADQTKYNVTITVDNTVKHVSTTESTVSAALKDAGIKVGPADIVNPNQDTRITAGMKISVVRVTEKVVLQKEPIAFTTKRQPTKDLRVGLTQVASEGEPGLKHLYYKVRFLDGVVDKRELMRAEVVTKPKDKVILFGDRGAGVSRGSFTSRRVLTMKASAYDPGPRSCGSSADGKTCIGMKAGFGVVAVDPKVIPLRSRLYIEGYGHAIAGDRGRAIKGNRIDLGFDTYEEAIRFGRKTVTVHILE